MQLKRALGRFPTNCSLEKAWVAFQYLWTSPLLSSPVLAPKVQTPSRLPRCCSNLPPPLVPPSSLSPQEQPWALGILLICKSEHLKVKTHPAVWPCLLSILSGRCSFYSLCCSPHPHSAPQGHSVPSHINAITHAVFCTKHHLRHLLPILRVSSVSSPGEVPWPLDSVRSLYMCSTYCVCFPFKVFFF